jgi:hypothetical protein
MFHVVVHAIPGVDPFACGLPESARKVGPDERNREWEFECLTREEAQMKIATLTSPGIRAHIREPHAY